MRSCGYVGVSLFVRKRVCKISVEKVAVCARLCDRIRHVHRMFSEWQ